MVIIKYITQINATSKGLPRTLFLLIALLFGSLLLVSCEEPEPTEELPSGVSGYINGFAYVDLGLSVKWAACNVGAYAPDDYGNYYAWGETGFKTEYTRENSVMDSVEIGDIGGNSLYDVATVRYGTPWRLPTDEEVDELVANCTYSWETVHGIVGGRLTSKINGNSIFLPGAGHLFKDNLYNLGGGFYWTSIPNGLNGARILSMGNAGVANSSWQRCFGCTVRSVVK